MEEINQTQNIQYQQEELNDMREEIKDYVRQTADKQFLETKTKAVIKEEVIEALKGKVDKFIIAKEDYYKTKKDNYIHLASIVGYVVLVLLRKYTAINYVAACFMGLHIYFIFIKNKYMNYLNNKYYIEPSKNE